MISYSATVSEALRQDFDYTMVDRVVETILERCDPDLILLFGSVAGGTAIYGSDIDILVVMETDERPIDRGRDILEALEVSASVDLIVMTPEEFETHRNNPRSFTSHILNSGRLVYGSDHRDGLRRIRTMQRCDS